MKRFFLAHLQFIRFFVTVVLAYGVYVIAYWVLSRWVLPSGNKELENVMAICLGDGFNFWLNRRWTFRATGSYARHIRRFVLVAGSSLLLQVICFWIGRSLFHIYDLILVILLPGLRALFNYFFHKIYTFREDASPVSDVL